MNEQPEAAPIDPREVMPTRRFIALLVLASVVGLIASLAAWCFLELIHETQTGAFEKLPEALGFETAPTWWPLPVLTVAGALVAVTVARLPGRGGHIPAAGLNATPTTPVELPGVLFAALAGIGLGTVLGPEAPLIALGGGLGLLAIRTLRSDAPPELAELVASSGIFAALSFLFGSPVIAAVFVIEASGIGGSRQPLVLVPGLLAAGIGSLVSTGMGSWTGVSTSAISLEPVPLPDYARPDLVDFLWTVPLAAAIAVGTFLIFRLGTATVRPALARPLLVVPAVGLLIAGLAIGFSEATDKGLDEVLYSGQDQLGPLVADAGAWSLGALALLIACKGLAYGAALGSFRGGPVFPAMFLGAAAGLMASHLPGFALTAAVAVGMAAAVAAVLRLPLAAVVLATLLVAKAGLGVTPLIIVGAATAYLTALALPQPRPEGATPDQPDPAPAAAT